MTEHEAANRDLAKLRPDVCAAWRKLEELTRAVGLDLLLTEGYRSNARQEWLFAQGRTRPGRIVTNARPGESAHNAVDFDGNPASLAFDVCFIAERSDSGAVLRVSWSGPWRTVGALGVELCGLAWGGDWNRPDRPHLYMRE